MPFLSVITRCYQRPKMLEHNIGSLSCQVDGDYEQLFILDEEGRGIGWANRALAEAMPEGEYVLVLDDDDLVAHDAAIGILKVAARNNPHMIIFRADHGDLGVLPDATIWGKRPLKGHIGSCDFITRRDVWDRHIPAFGVDEGGDYEFLKSVWSERPEVVWLDEQLTAIQRRSNGAPE